MSDYLTLAIGAPRRLAILKRAADKLNAGHNARKASGNLSPYTWRDMRHCGFHNARAGRCELSPGLQNNRPIWYAHTGQQFPRERYADEIARINHTGWFTDCEGFETARGLVVSLPHGRFLAGYHWSDNGERVYFSDIYDCEEDAAHAADGEAECFAESCREYAQAWEWARAWSDLADELKETRQDARELIAAMRAERKSGRTAATAICDALRAQLATMSDAYTRQKAERQAIADNFHYLDDSRKSWTVAEFAQEYT